MVAKGGFGELWRVRLVLIVNPDPESGKNEWKNECAVLELLGKDAKQKLLKSCEMEKDKGGDLELGLKIIKIDSSEF